MSERTAGAMEESEFSMLVEQADKEFEERRRDPTICILCDSKNISIIDLIDGPAALCGDCLKKLDYGREIEKMAKLGEK